MTNKTSNKPINPEQSKFYEIQLEQTTIQQFQPAERIFPPPSFLFDAQDERRFSERKICFNTLNSFKPKLERKSIRELSSHGKRSHSNGKHKVLFGQQTKQYSTPFREKMAQILQNDLQTFRDHHKAHLHIKPPSEEGPRTVQSDFVKKGYESQEVSPFFKSTSNIFHQKTMNKSKGLKNKKEFVIELGKPTKQPMTDQLQQFNLKLSKLAAKDVLEVMTIFSIKEQKKQKQPVGKVNFSRKREMTKSLALDKKHKIRYVKKQRYLHEEPDYSADKIYFKKINSFFTFALKVLYSNNLPISKIFLSDKYTGEKVKVYVGNGNNKYLIISLLKRRFWMEVTSKVTTDTKFVWTQNSIKDIHQRQQPYEALKNIQQMRGSISIKTQLSQGKEGEKSVILAPHNIGMQEERQKKSIFTKIPEVFHPYKSLSSESTTKLPHQKNNPNIDHQHNYKLFLNPQKKLRVEWQLRNFKLYSKSKSENINIESIHTITNHIPNNSFIGSKKALFYTMEHYYRNIKNIDPFTIIPKTYHFKSSDEEAFINFIQNQKTVNQKKIWIVKPGECTNRGNGIYLTRAADISRKLLKREFHSNGQNKTTIVQSYITDPLLYNGRKFDIRHFMMITSINGNLKAYWYQEGYLRTSSQHFSLQNLSNNYIHLTNDAIQKTSERYGRYEPANKVSYSQFQRYLDNNHSKKQINFREDVLTKMKGIARDVVKANYLNLDKGKKMNNFEVFGLDFMIDSKFSPWLIEINANPCLQISCCLLSGLIPTMIQNSFRLGLDPLIPPPSHYPTHSRYYLSDSFTQKLKYEIIFDELEEVRGTQIKLNYDFDFDEPQDEYQNEGTEIDLSKVID